MKELINANQIAIRQQGEEIELLKQKIIRLEDQVYKLVDNLIKVQKDGKC
jgi:hypothetical protein